jgi:hypothetical protein
VYVEQESVLKAAGFHVTQARTMSGMVQDIIKDTIECVFALKMQDTRDRVLVYDYAHNINYPHLGGGSQEKFTTFRL